MKWWYDSWDALVRRIEPNTNPSAKDTSYSPWLHSGASLWTSLSMVEQQWRVKTKRIHKNMRRKKVLERYSWWYSMYVELSTDLNKGNWIAFELTVDQPETIVRIGWLRSKCLRSVLPWITTSPFLVLWKPWETSILELSVLQVSKKAGRLKNWRW